MQRRIAIIGGGAIGAVMAAATHGSGHAVALCVRSPFERLTLETPEGTHEVPVTIHTEPRDVAAVDWVLLTTKIQDAANAAPWLHHFDDGETPVVIMQNGVEHKESIDSLGLRAPLLPALIYVGAERVRKGHVIRRSDTSVTVPSGDLGARFAELFDHSGTTPRQSRDFHTAAWRKMLMNVAANPITALTLRRLDVFGEPDVRQLAEGVLAEAVEVATAEGAELTQADIGRVMDTYSGVFLPDNGTSMLYDRLTGATTEHEHITGPVVRAGQRHGIPTPLNHTLLALMRVLRPT